MQEQATKKNNFLFIYCTVIALLLLFVDLYFYRAKLSDDAAYYLFQIVNSESFFIAHRRLISHAIEILPYFLTKISAPMDLIIFSFVLNQWLFLTSCLIITAFVFKDLKATCGALFAILLGTQLNYFNPVSELIWSTPLFFIFGCLLKQRNSSHLAVMSAFLATLLIFSHPLNSIIVFCILILNQFYLNEWPSKFNISLFVGVTILIFMHNNILDDYEKNPLQYGKPENYNPISAILSFSYAESALAALREYPGAVTLPVLTVFLFLRQRLGRLIGPYLLFTAGHFFLTMYFFSFLPAGGILERFLYPITVLTCFCFFNYIRIEPGNILKKRILYIAVLILPFYNYCKIIDIGLATSIRRKQLRNAIQYAHAFKEDKLAFRRENYFAGPLDGYWMMANESLISSARRGPGYTKQLIIADADPYTPDIISSLNENNFLESPYSVQPIDTLNQKYFQLDRSPIRWVNTDSIQVNESDDYFQNIKVEVTAQSIMEKGKMYLLPIVITNNNDRVLTSGMKKEFVHLTTTWSKSGKPLPWDPEKSPLRADVFDILEQRLIVKTPDRAGTYHMKVHLVFHERKNPDSIWTVEKSIMKSINSETLILVKDRLLDTRL